MSKMNFEEIDGMKTVTPATQEAEVGEVKQEEVGVRVEEVAVANKITTPGSKTRIRKQDPFTLADSLTDEDYLYIGEIRSWNKEKRDLEHRKYKLQRSLERIGRSDSF